MGITQEEFTASEEEEYADAEDNEIADEERFFGPPQPVTIDDYIEDQVYVSDNVPNPPLLPVPYPNGSRELRSLSYRTVPAPKLMTRELKGLQSSNIHFAYINRQIKPEKDIELTKLRAAFKSIAGLNDVIDTLENYMDVLGHKNQGKWWESMKQEINAMERKGV
jgi:hypothetical protein